MLAYTLAYTSAELRSISSVKVRLRRPQCNDVIARVALLGLYVAHEAREPDVGATRDLIIAQPPGTP